MGVVNGEDPALWGLHRYGYKVETTPRHLLPAPLHLRLTAPLPLNPHPHKTRAELELWSGSLWTAGFVYTCGCA